ncbi:MAG: diguanylate cyclase [Deltaproteobacteria bacterium]
MNSGQKILIVDDDAVVRNIVKGILAGEGYQIMEASTGNEALRKAVVDRPDLILLDLLMPGMDGFEVCRRLRTELNDLAVPVIILSAKAEKEDILKGLEVGANDYITKPVEPIELKARIKTHLRLKGLYDIANTEKKELMALLEVSQAVSSSLHSRDILYNIVKSVAGVIEVNRCSILRIGKKKGIGYVVTTYENPNIKNLPIELDKYPEIRKALDVKEAVVVEDINSDPLMAGTKEILEKLKLSSLMVIPIMVREEVVGTLFLRTSRKEGSFTQREVRLCQVIANMAGNALANAHLFESLELANLELEKLAVTDGLTGAYNHRHFRTRLEEEFSRAKRYKTSLSCIMLDLDHFKSINDAFGHAQGDIVLKEITDALRKSVRKTDVVARYGGEEFVILLPHTDQEGAFIHAERIREAARGNRCSDSNTCIMVTVSLGVSTFPSPDINSADELVGKADNALYEAKRNGRNKTVAA